jgi:hypothetical protein
MRNAYTNYVGKPEGKRPHGRHEIKWRDNIKMNLESCVVMLLTLMKLRVPRKRGITSPAEHQVFFKKKKHPTILNRFRLRVPRPNFVRGYPQSL